MSDISLSFEYKGTKQDAFDQMKKMEQKAHEQYPEFENCWEITWQDNGGLLDARIMGMDITGQFEIVERDATGGDIKATITLPALLSMMKGMIETRIKSEIQKMLKQYLNGWYTVQIFIHRKRFPVKTICFILGVQELNHGS